MALTYPQMMLKIFISLLYSTFFFTVAVYGYDLKKQYIPEVESDGVYKKMIKFFYGTFLHLAATLASLCLLIWNLSNMEEDDQEESEEVRRTRSIGNYQRKLCTYTLKEASTQTKEDMLLALERDNPEKESNTIFPEISISDDSMRVHLFSNRLGFQNRQVSSSPGLLYKPFNINSTRLILACERFQVDPDTCQTTFQDLGGMVEMKKTLARNVLAPFVNSARSRVISPNTPRGILLIGNEGTGKTSISHAIFNEVRRGVPSELGVKFYRVDGANCFGPFIRSGVTFRDIFYYACESSPVAILLFENIENLFDHSISIFLSELGSFPKGKLFVIATSTRKDRLHERLILFEEPGKFDYIFELRPPDLWERAAILKIHFQKRECLVKENDILELANMTSSFIPAELEKLVKLANANHLEKYWKEESSKCNSLETRSSSWKNSFKEITRPNLTKAFSKINRIRIAKREQVTANKRTNYYAFQT